MAEQVAYHRVSDTPDLVLSDGRYTDFHFDPHYHIDYHFGLVVEGVQRQSFQGESVLLGPGRISVMPPGEIHDGRGEDQQGFRMITYRISDRLIGDYFSDIYQKDLYQRDSDPFFSGAMVENPHISTELIQLFSGIQAGQALTDIASEERWIGLLQPLISDLTRINPEQIKGGLSARHWQQVRDYCHAHLGEKILLEELAGLCGLSRYQFLRRFEKTVGITPHNWLTRLRLEYACREIQKGESRIAEIATDFGFYDQSHFNRAFRQAYGVAPSAY